MKNNKKFKKFLINYIMQTYRLVIFKYFIVYKAFV